MNRNQQADSYSVDPDYPDSQFENVPIWGDNMYEQIENQRIKFYLDYDKPIVYNLDTKHEQLKFAKLIEKIADYFSLHLFLDLQEGLY